LRNRYYGEKTFKSSHTYIKREGGTDHQLPHPQILECIWNLIPDFLVIESFQLGIHFHFYGVPIY